jgi:hypothetical protein
LGKIILTLMILTEWIALGFFLGAALAEETLEERFALVVQDAGLYFGAVVEVGVVQNGEFGASATAFGIIDSPHYFLKSCEHDGAGAHRTGLFGDI